MTRKQVSRYRYLLNEIKKEEAAVNKLVKQQEKVPIVKDKVQSSMKEFPYTPTHETVDAPEPNRYTRLERLIIVKEKHIEELQEERIKIEELINSADDSRTRQILKAVYIDGRSYVSIATELEITPGYVSQILKKFFSQISEE